MPQHRSAGPDIEMPARDEEPARIFSQAMDAFLTRP
jgi:hypothetical protein